MADIRKRAASLDPGREQAKLIEDLSAELARRKQQAEALSGEQLDKELEQKGLLEKLKKLDKTLYGGSVVAPREVETYEAEILAAKKRQEQIDIRLLELYEEAPAAKKHADSAEQALLAARKKLAEHQQKVKAQQADLQSRFSQLGGSRASAAAKVDQALLAQYEALRRRLGGVAMSEVGKSGACERCGVQVPERILSVLREGRTAGCESCHRMLILRDHP